VESEAIEEANGNSVCFHYLPGALQFPVHDCNSPLLIGNFLSQVFMGELREYAQSERVQEFLIMARVSLVY
jgi:hypothetical protein